jgi:hypothetical protein
MFENPLYRNLAYRNDHQNQNEHRYYYDIAIHHFESALLEGQIFRAKNRVLRRPWRLYDLHSIKLSMARRGISYSGIQGVDIHKIIGTEGRAADFDLGFHPIKEESRERWVNMAHAYLLGVPLPPVELIRVGDVYFVRDGHHRVSVALALGQKGIDAEVITWRVAPVLAADEINASCPNIGSTDRLTCIPYRQCTGCAS